MRYLAVLLLLFAFPLFSEEPKALIENGQFNSEAGSMSSWSVRNGGLGSTSARNGIFKAQVRELSARPWTMELHQLINPSVSRGTLAVISFEYNISAGYAFNFYWQVEKSPWPKLLSLHLDKSDGWQTVKMAVPIHETLEEKSTALSFHLGGNVGTLELRNVAVMLYPEGTSPEAIDTTVQAVLGGDFYDKDWRDSAQARIKDVRQSEYTLQWKPNSEVHIRQLDRPFSIGVECPLSLLSNSNVPKGIDAARLSQYRKAVLDKQIFDSVTFSDGVTWRDYENWGHSVLAKAVEDVHAAGLSVRGHALYIPAFMFAPVNCRRMTPAQLEKALNAHIEKLASIPGIDAWNVVHGAVEYPEIYNAIGVESMQNAFNIAQKASPKSSLLVSDVNALCAMSDVALRDTVEFAKWLIQSKVKVDGVVLGVTVNRPDVAPQSMERRLDYVLKELKIPIYISGFAVNADTEEQHQAMMQDYMTLFFSHPGVYGVTFGEIWGPARLNPKMALLGEDLQENPTGVAMRKLLTQDWRTDMTVRTDAAGKATFRAYKGTYECTIGDEKMTIQIK